MENTQVSTQPLTETSTKNLPDVKKSSESKCDNLTAICEPIVWDVGASAAHNTMGLQVLLQG
jgi:hypothetical protein